jgi:hypothetical protein
MRRCASWLVMVSIAMGNRLIFWRISPDACGLIRWLDGVDGDRDRFFVCGNRPLVSEESVARRRLFIGLGNICTSHNDIYVSWRLLRGNCVEK